jgi:RimJ/RimL family protein N-acetyltransferase
MVLYAVGELEVRPGAPFIDGESVVLRAFEEDDLQFVRDAINDASIRTPLGITPPLNLDQQRSYYESVVCDEEGTVQLIVAVDTDPVGVVELPTVNRSAGHATLGYWIVPDQQGNGYASEATRLLVDYAFDQLRLHRVQATVFAFNEPSIAVLETLGFTREGTRRDYAFVDGQYRDEHLYALLADER